MENTLLHGALVKISYLRSFGAFSCFVPLSLCVAEFTCISVFPSMCMSDHDVALAYWMERMCRVELPGFAEIGKQYVHMLVSTCTAQIVFVVVVVLCFFVSVLEVDVLCPHHLCRFFLETNFVIHHRRVKLQMVISPL